MNDRVIKVCAVRGFVCVCACVCVCVCACVCVCVRACARSHALALALLRCTGYLDKNIAPCFPPGSLCMVIHTCQNSTYSRSKIRSSWQLVKTELVSEKMGANSESAHAATYYRVTLYRTQKGSLFVCPTH